MGAHRKSAEATTAESAAQTTESRLGTILIWLGGGHGASTAAQERSSYQVAGLLVVLGGLLAWLVATAAIVASTEWPVFGVLPFTLVFGLVVGAVARALASGTRRTIASIAGRVVVALFLGVVVGELAALSLFAGPIDRALDADAARQAASAPAVVAAGRTLDQLAASRAGLDTSVNEARQHVDAALVVARCEANPSSPACPREKITGVPGVGPETRNANERLARAQAELDTAVATRTKNAAALDADIARAQTDLSVAQAAAPRDVDRSLGARWTAMHDYTAGSFGAFLFRVLASAFFVLLIALPAVLRFWRGETQLDRHEQARAVRHRAEEDADTAIALKRAEIRAEAEKLWAEQQLAKARMAAEAESAIEREQHRRRVVAVLGDEAPTALESTVELHQPLALSAPAEADDVTVSPDEPTPLADATAADLAQRERARNLPARAANLPARAAQAPARRSGPFGLIPHIEVPSPIHEVGKVASAVVTPFVPPVVAKAFGLRKTEKTSVEEFEEIKFSFTRSRKVTHDSEHVDEQHAPHAQAARGPEAIDAAAGYEGRRRIGSERVAPEYTEVEGWTTDALHGPPQDLTRSVTRTERGELAPRRGPRELPPGR